MYWDAFAYKTRASSTRESYHPQRVQVPISFMGRLRSRDASFFHTMLRGADSSGHKTLTTLSVMPGITPQCINPFMLPFPREKCASYREVHMDPCLCLYAWVVLPGNLRVINQTKRPILKLPCATMPYGMVPAHGSFKKTKNTINKQ